MIVTTALAVTAALAALQPSAGADARTSLRLDGFFDLAVDEAHGHVYVSQDRGSSELVVLDLKGEPVGVIAGMGGARGLVLSEDATRLYVGLSDDHAIAEIDTSTLEVVAEHPLPSWTTGSQTMPSCPQDLVRVGRLVVFGDYCPNKFSAIRIFDPATADVPVTHPGSGSGRLVFSAAHGILVALIGGYDISSFDVEADPVAIVDRGDTSVLNQTTDLAVIPGTDRLVVESGLVLDMRDLSVVGAYDGSPVNAPTQPEPETVVAREDGVVAFGLHRYSPAGDVRVYSTTTHLMRDHAFVSTDDPIFQDEELSFRRRSLEFGEEVLYGIEFADRGSEARFWAIRPREDTVLRVTTRKKRYARGERVTVDVRAAGPLQSRRGIAWIERWDRNDQVSGRVPYRLDRSGHAVVRFALRVKSTIHVTLNDGGDLVVSAKIIGFRR
ncbi:hypothetical protein DJ010_16630 [Nocardioides silvaticus]|uniref:YncE family protein n=1 Tax=Nocardioides silvaticus TaxID=2201891 RepID=A0A316TBI3_9ACTN|nr:hypothetical protein DJ010_16630 [Nocardioides silvaticus]